MRKKRGVTVEGLAREVGVGHTYIVFIETNKKDPSIKILERISDYFGVATDYLLGREEL
ncbi:MAG: helix-turn-helix domain-containing protein [Oscillospiraceae bacterium]|nr:helix-turn-helix domain-containing protein [Oscillospiraceae bacterium]